MFHFFLILKSLNGFSFYRNHPFLAELIIKNNRLSFVIYRRPLCGSTGDIRLYKLKKTLLQTKWLMCLQRLPDRIMIFDNDTSSVGSFVNVKNGASEIEKLRARDESEINADEYIDTDDWLFTFETCAMTDDEILSKVTSIEEDEENCQDTDEIEDLIQPPTKYETMQAFEVLQTCAFYDADVGDEMRAKVNAFSKLYDISMTKAKR